MKTLEQIKEELTKIRNECKTEEQFIEVVAVMYLSCVSDREFLSNQLKEIENGRNRRDKTS